MIGTQQCIAFAIVYAVATIKQKSCSVHCDTSCTGYGPVNATHCAICVMHVDPPAVATADVAFAQFIPRSTYSGGCTSNKVCLACPQHRSVSVSSNTRVYLSKSCNVYTPLNPGDPGAHLTLSPGAKNVVIVGPGTVTSDTWPLNIGTPLRIANVTFAPPPDSVHINGPAVTVTSHGVVDIIGHAPLFRVLVSVYGLHARPVRMHSGSQIMGTARDALAGLGHVSGKLALECVDNTSYVVMQELPRDDHRKITLGETCIEINLSKLLGFYGSEYEQMLFNDYDKHKPPWKAVKIATFIVAILTVAILLGRQPEYENKRLEDAKKNR